LLVIGPEAENHPKIDFKLAWMNFQKVIPSTLTKDGLVAFLWFRMGSKCRVSGRDLIDL